MSATENKRFRRLSAVPTLLRIIGISGVAAACLAVIAGFYFSGSDGTFRSKDFPTALSKNVIGVIEGYDRKTSVDGVPKYSVKASKATTFDDNHQEFENVRLRLYKDGDEDRFDSIRSDRAVFIPDEKDEDQFRIFFRGDVEIESEAQLRVNTEELQYRSKEELALAEETVEFARDNLSGKAGSAIVDIKNETLELKDAVSLTSSGKTEVEDAALNVKSAELSSGYAFLRKDNESVLLRDKVSIYVIPEGEGEVSEPTRIKSEKAELFFKDRQPRSFDLKSNVYIEQKAANGGTFTGINADNARGTLNNGLEAADLVGNVIIKSKRGSSQPIEIRGDSASYDKSKERFEVRDSVRVNSTRDEQPLVAEASRAVFLRNQGELTLDGGVKITAGEDSINGERVFARLSKSEQLEYARADGNSSLFRKNRVGESVVKGDTIDADFDSNGKVETARVRGKTRISNIPSEKSDYSKFTMDSSKGLNVGFRRNGDLSSTETIGRTTIYLNEGNRKGMRADRKLTADKIKTVFRTSGNEMLRAHAIGNAVLVETPKNKSSKDFVSTVRSPRFVCEFFGKNRAKQCDGVKRSVITRKPTVGGIEPQSLESNRVSALFDEKTGDVAAFVANGRSRFSQGDRKGSANKIAYTESNGIVRLTGNPQVWDSAARAKAETIIWNTRKDTSSLLGKISTTYFDSGGSGNVTPFNASGTPVYVTATRAGFDHKKRTAVYEGNARAWQGKNYVSAEKLFLDEKAGTFYAEKQVRSGLYDASRTVAGRKTSSPVFVTAEQMLFERAANRLTYRQKVDIRQGSDRIVADSAEVFLNPDNTLSKTIAKGGVVITQPNRKATGDYASYDAVSEVVRLRGNPATFRDAESGSSNGRTLTVDLKKNTATNEGRKTKTSSGRIRSVYKVKGGRLN